MTEKEKNDQEETLEVTAEAEAKIEETEAPVAEETQEDISLKRSFELSEMECAMVVCRINGKKCNKLELNKASRITSRWRTRI